MAQVHRLQSSNYIFVCLFWWPMATTLVSVNLIANQIIADVPIAQPLEQHYNQNYNTRTSYNNNNSNNNSYSFTANSGSLSATATAVDNVGQQSTSQRQQQQFNEPLDRISVADESLAASIGIKPDSKVTATIGQNVILNCQVNFKDGIEKPFVVNWIKLGYKIPIYIWYAGYPPHIAEGYDHRVSRIGQASLNLTNVKETDQGLYECKIYYLDRRSEDNINGTWVFLNVQGSPHFTETPPEITYVQRGDNITLSCGAESTPRPVLKWYKDKVAIDNDDGPYRLRHWPPGQADNRNSDNSNNNDNDMTGGRHSGDGNSNKLELVIDNVQPGVTTGHYVCLASNSEGSVETSAQLLIAVPAYITQAPRNQTRLEGDRVEMSCQARALPNNITYKWFFNDKLIDKTVRHIIRRDGTLIIQSLTSDDQGAYKCQASNGISPVMLPSKASSSLSSPPPPPILQQQQHYRSQQSPSFVDHYHGHQIDASSASMISAATTTTTMHSEASAYLTVEYAARVTYSPPLQYLPLGLSGIVRCYVESQPAFTAIHWTFNNMPFDATVQEDIETLNNGSLLFKRVAQSNEGKYRCTPMNIHGSAGSSANMEVRVEDPPEFVIKPADLYKANVDGQIKLPCNGRGRPKPSVTWRRSDGFKMASQDRLDYRDGNLLIHNLRKEDHGRYECVLANDIATLVSSTQLYIEETTPHSPSNFQVHTKAWSATLTWLPGYDGGYDQTFDAHYRQVKQQQVQLQHTPTSALFMPATAPPAPPATTTSTVIDDAAVSSSSSFEDDDDAAVNTKSNKAQDLIGTKASTTTTTPANSDIDRAEQASTSRMTMESSSSSSTATTTTTKQQQRQQHLDNDNNHYRWHSVSVEPAGAQTITIDNLLEDTEYEFYVRPRNVLGDGSRSPIVRATTGRSISGVLVLTTESATGKTSGLLAPRNVSVAKVAQGWVVSWLPPLQHPGTQQQQQQHHRNSNSIDQVDSNVTMAFLQQQQQQQHQQAGRATTDADFYIVELKEKRAGLWSRLEPAVKEHSRLVENLKPGTEYIIRVVASTLAGAGQPSEPIEFQLPDNRKKPGGAQALSAGIMGGVLFFIAAIVISVCTVKMCNNRRTKRGKKAAYVMMSCPVLEHHHQDPVFNSSALLATNKRLEMNSYPPLLNGIRKSEYRV